MSGKTLTRPQSEPGLDGTVQADWTSGWDASPSLAAAPRFGIAQGDDSTKVKVRRLGAGVQDPLRPGRGVQNFHDKPFPLQNNRPLNDNGHWRLRDTAQDKLLRQNAWIPTPGHYGTNNRLFDCPKENFHTNGHAVDRAVHHKFSRVPRSASLPFYKKGQAWGKSLEERHTAVTVRDNDQRLSRLPSSQFSPGLAGKFTPGPGSYTCYSGFGAASGPTRHRFFATNGADNFGCGRQVGKFDRGTSHGIPNVTSGA